MLQKNFNTKTNICFREFLVYSLSGGGGRVGEGFQSVKRKEGINKILQFHSKLNIQNLSSAGAQGLKWSVLRGERGLKTRGSNLKTY